MEKWLSDVMVLIPKECIGVVVVSLVVIFLLIRHLDKTIARYESSIHELSENTTAAILKLSEMVSADKETLTTLIPFIIRAIGRDRHDC